MAEQAQQPDLASQYDVEPTPQSQPDAAGSSAETPQPSLPPRRADGTFLPKHSHPERLVGLAKKLGLSEEEIHTSSTADLRDTIRDIQLEQDHAWRSEMLTRREPPAPEPPKITPEPAAPQAEEFNYEDYDEGLAKILKALVAENKAMREQIAQIGGHVQASANQTAMEQVDTEFNKRPDIFGKGTVNDMKPDSAEMIRRKTVYDLAKTYKEGSPGQKIAKAASILYPDPAQPPKPSIPSIGVEEWNEGTLARPTQRTGSAEPHGRDRAIRAVTEHLRENRDNGLGTQTTSLDDFPK